MGVIHMDDQHKTLQSWINESSYTVAVTGAGVSVTAGIPDIKAKAYLSLSGTKLYFEHYPFSVGLANRLLTGGTRRAHYSASDHQITWSLDARNLQQNQGFEQVL